MEESIKLEKPNEAGYDANAVPMLVDDKTTHFSIFKLVELLETVKSCNQKMHAEMRGLYKKSSRIYVAVNVVIAHLSIILLVVCNLEQCGSSDRNYVIKWIGSTSRFLEVVHVDHAYSFGSSDVAFHSGDDNPLDSS